MTPQAVEAVLQSTARSGHPLTYSETLNALGHPFSRPLMRQLCRVLEDVDARARGAAQPELAVLVVRQADGLPGDGWWQAERGYTGPWKGPQARAHVQALQARAFAYWSGTDPTPPG